MAYTVYITRKKNWMDEGPEITESEWLATVAKFPEIKTNTGSIVFGDKKVATHIWKDPVSDEEFNFYVYKGNINIDHPNKAVIDKAKQIAVELAAKVQGDESEIY